ncbi:MAG TPA: chloride channel protein [Bacteriovoracaceae bacterium]|nr:chloride channel protein [Bacteriovoracaceae bacterium]
MKLSFEKLDLKQKFFILNLLTGLAAGGVSILLHQGIHYLMDLFGTSSGFTLKSFILGGISLALGSYIVTKVMPACAGSGIPRTKVLLAVHHGVISTKEWGTKIITTIFSLSSGVPLGSEGPTIAVAAGVGSTLGRKFRLPERKVKSLVYAGASAGIAAAFNTPIAAVIFTMEEIIGNSSVKSMGPILISSLVASITAAALVGQNSVFTPVSYSFNSSFELIFYLALGIFAGVAGPLFISQIISVRQMTRKYFKHHKFTLAMFAFFIVGAISLYVPEITGNGLSVVNHLLQGHSREWHALLALLIVKFIACAFCYGAGISGGILMPVLFLGAVLGGLFGMASTHVFSLSEVEIGAYCLVGMGSFFAAVMRTPFTSIIIVFEMTHDYRIVLPLMLSCLVSYFLSERIKPGTIYERVAHDEGYELPSHDDEDLLNQTVVEEIYLSKEGRLDRPLPYAKFVYPDQSLSHALVKLRRLDTDESLIVVDRMNPQVILGEITLQNVFDFLSRKETLTSSV